MVKKRYVDLRQGELDCDEGKLSEQGRGAWSGERIRVGERDEWSLQVPRMRTV